MRAKRAHFGQPVLANARVSRAFSVGRCATEGAAPGEWSTDASQMRATRAQFCQEVLGNARGSRAFPTVEIREMMLPIPLFLGIWTSTMSDRLRHTTPVHTGGPRNARAPRALPATMHSRVQSLGQGAEATATFVVDIAGGADSCSV